jgi:hypothetical protein
MAHGLMWLPLLAAFLWLARLGSQEFKKLEAYRLWAEQFERAKYDIYAVLAQKDRDLTWGKPTTKGPINLQTFSLDNVKDIHLMVDDKPVDMETLPSKGRKIELEFALASTKVRVPFTEIPLAAEWGKYLRRELGTGN